MANIHQRVIKNIKRILALKAMLPEHLSRETGVDRGHLSRYLANKKSSSLETIEKLAKGLGVDIQHLFKP